MRWSRPLVGDQRKVLGKLFRQIVFNIPITDDDDRLCNLCYLNWPDG